MLSGCFTPAAAPSSDTDAKKFTPDAGKASVYVVRHGGMAPLMEILVHLDGNFTGTLDPGMYQVHSVDTGEHTVKVSASGENQELKFSVEAGKNYFYRTCLAPFAKKSTKLEPIGEQEGRQWVSSSKLAATIRKETEQLVK
jgi:hypothetical protein